MALVNCPDCGKEISDSATSCLHCGRPMFQSNTAMPTPAPMQQTVATGKPKKVNNNVLVGIGLIIFFVGIAQFVSILEEKFGNTEADEVKVAGGPSQVDKATIAAASANTDTEGKESADQSTQRSDEFKAFFKKELKQLKPKWHDVEFLDSYENDYRLAINYNESANVGGYEEVARDTKFVARAVLKTLVAMGHKPSKEHTSVFVHAYQPVGVGETGTPLIQRLGRASYDYNSDQIKFSLPECSILLNDC